MAETFKRSDYDFTKRVRDIFDDIALCVFEAEPLVQVVIVSERAKLTYEIVTPGIVLDDPAREYLQSRRLRGFVLNYTLELTPEPPPPPPPTPKRRGRPPVVGGGFSRGQRVKLRRLVEQGKLDHKWGDTWIMTDEIRKLLGKVK